MKKLYTLLSVFVLATAANAQTNLIPNGGFETWTAGAPDSWTITPATNGGTATQETADVHGGTSALKMTAPAGTGNIRAAVTDFAVVAGHSYTLTYWYKDATDNARGRHWGAWRTATAGVTPADTSLQPDYYPNSTGGAWQLVTVTATAPATATILRFDFRVYQDTGNSGVILYDDVVLIDNTLGVKNNNIAGLKVYPNPVTGGKFSITTNSNADKTVAIFDVLGKQVLNTIATETVNVSNLKAGVYIVKITEEGNTATRKLVIK